MVSFPPCGLNKYMQRVAYLNAYGYGIDVMECIRNEREGRKQERYGDGEMRERFMKKTLKLLQVILMVKKGRRKRQSIKQRLMKRVEAWSNALFKACRRTHREIVKKNKES